MPARPSPCPSRISTLQNHPAPATQNGLRNVTRAIPRFSALGCLCIGFKKHTFCSSISMTMPRTKPPVISDIDRSPRSRIHTSEGHRTENHREVYHRAFARTVLENHDPHDPSRRSTMGFSYGFPPKKHLFLSDSGKVRSCFWPKKTEKKADLPEIWLRLTACWLLLTRLTCLVFLRRSGWTIDELGKPGCLENNCHVGMDGMAYNPSKWWFSGYIPSGND